MSREGWSSAATLQGAFASDSDFGGLRIYAAEASVDDGTGGGVEGVVGRKEVVRTVED
jgi:hypothetical protein